MRIGSTAVIAAAALSVGAASASADILVRSAPSCDAQATSTPFTHWLDYSSYTSLPGGSFEPGSAAWSATGGAGVAAGNESYAVAGAGDGSSLSIPAGGSATSPTVCVGLDHPTLRFFAKRNTPGFLGLSTMHVDVLFESNLGLINSVPIGDDVPVLGGWQPTQPMAIIANLLPLLPGQYTPVQFRFTPTAGGDWSIDDAYVDPYNRH